LNNSAFIFSRRDEQAHTLARLASLIVLFAAFLLCNSALQAAQSEADASCLVPGRWFKPDVAELRQVAAADVLARTEDAQFVLLGEAHDSANHHLWQLQTLGMLLGEHAEIVIGMEMFPRRVQPVLDRWIAGELTEAALLQQSEWARVWRFDPDLYLPILRFARLNRIPVVALNVERSLISDIGAHGLSEVSPGRREGVTDPAPATSEYRDVLRSSFHQHSQSGDSDFEHFVEAQLFWDKAFSQALADAAAARPDALVVGIIGSGHLRHGHGVPHQLRAMGEGRTTVWLPVGASSSCSRLVNIADSVFAVRSGPAAARPRLGVYLGDEAGGAGVREVVPGSVAEGAGVISGDRILVAAGIDIRRSDDLIAIVRRQSPGTWLPMTIERNGKRIELVAKFPAGEPASSVSGEQPDSDPDAQKDD